ncbi:MBOAT family protein [Roseomonas sp. M0104]|uniref:Probable alginate O-acetylase AlgI n=1 Tax=Teichococcus coralli TaxID=2545983 RepID=A0A845B756_9PROT|nr:MBOAT family protein [Pseudoroseomonas coralli]MXP62080.1 MBOAT family protein [Pseudoroseomonas coralli]
MLFNSHVFILLFLPLTLAGFFLLGRLRDRRPARLWLLAASLVFYGWWSLTYLGLLLGSMLVNYALGRRIGTIRLAAPGRAKALMLLGVAGNIALLAWYKYAIFIAGNLATLTGLDFAVGGVVLPLAISFYTFLQIAYLVDTRNGRAEDYSLLDYTLFVTFFPHLIAGPIVHHHELIPQFHRRATYRFQPEEVAAGVTFFAIGLIKKLVIADPVGALATPVFQGAAEAPPGLLEAWLGTVAFSVGLYFDFSAYSDMAIGLARMFGVRFPYNFNSPYKADSIIDFWRRWHMTLSRFLRDYVYIAMGGSRRGPLRRHANLMATMLLGGLWHGAGWTFVVWGGLHGAYLLANHAWRSVARSEHGLPRLGPRAAQLLTLLAVMLAWVFFAAPDLGAALAVLGGMAGLNGPMQAGTADLLGAALQGGPAAVVAITGGMALLRGMLSLLILGGALLAIFLAPNSQEIVDGRAGAPDEPQRWRRLRFRPRATSACTAAAAFLLALALMADVKEFVYFQF